MCKYVPESSLHVDFKSETERFSFPHLCSLTFRERQKRLALTFHGGVLPRYGSTFVAFSSVDSEVDVDATEVKYSNSRS